MQTLTRDEVLKLEGDALDEAIAELLMGLKVETRAGWAGRDYRALVTPLGSGCPTCGYDGRWNSYAVPAYSYCPLAFADVETAVGGMGPEVQRRYVAALAEMIHGQPFYPTPVGVFQLMTAAPLVKCRAALMALNEVAQ